MAENDDGMVTTYEMTISILDYEKILNFAEDYGFSDSVPNRKNMSVYLDGYYGIIDKDFSATGTYVLDNLDLAIMPSSYDPSDSLLMIVGTPSKSFSETMNHMKKQIPKKEKSFIGSFVSGLVISGDYEDDITDKMERSLNTYLGGTLRFSEITKRYDTMSNLFSIMNAHTSQF